MPKPALPTFKDAAAFLMPFGMHKGKTMDQVGSTDKGLLYLDYMRAEREHLTNPFDLALKVYLEDPTIAKALAALAKDRD